MYGSTVEIVALILFKQYANQIIIYKYSNMTQNVALLILVKV